MEYFFVEGDEGEELEPEFYADAQVDVDQIEQEEVVVTADAPTEDSSPTKKEASSSNKDQQEHVTVV